MASPIDLISAENQPGDVNATMVYEASFGLSHMFVPITCDENEFVLHLKELARECKNLWPGTMENNISSFLEEYTDVTDQEREVIVRDLKHRLYNPTIADLRFFEDRSIDDKLVVFAFTKEESPSEDFVQHFLAEIRKSPPRLPRYNSPM